MKTKLLALTLLFVTSAKCMDNQEIRFTIPANSFSNIISMGASLGIVSPLIAAMYTSDSSLYTAGDDIVAFKSEIEKLGNINQNDTYGCTPLMYAVTLKKLQLVKMLLRAGADVTIKNSYGLTALQQMDKAIEIGGGNQMKNDFARLMTSFGGNGVDEEKVLETASTFQDACKNALGSFTCMANDDEVKQIRALLIEHAPQSEIIQEPLD